jgi:hypothetical protein
MRRKFSPLGLEKIKSNLSPSLKNWIMFFMAVFLFTGTQGFFTIPSISREWTPVTNVPPKMQDDVLELLFSAATHNPGII